MKRLLWLLAVQLLFTTALRAQDGACRIVRDIAYREAAGDGYIDSLCRLDLCCPTGGQGFPTVIWFHGGGLEGGRREIPERAVRQGLCRRGRGYRLVPRVKVADCVADAAAAAAWVVEHIADYGGDPRLIFVAGHSAGGYLTSMIGLDKRWLAPYGIDPDEAFAALIPYSGQAVTHFARRRELGCCPIRSRWSTTWRRCTMCAPMRRRCSSSRATASWRCWAVTRRTPISGA